MTTFVEQIAELRKRINTPVLDHLERMLNASKGAGTTTLLVDAAKRQNVTLVVHSEEWAEKLRDKSPTLDAVPYTSSIGGRRVLIDNGVNWLLLREAQALRRMTETLLNTIEAQKIKPKES